MNLLNLIKEKRTEIMTTAAKYGARNVRLFGSVAQGNAGPDSDIDLLIDMENGRSLLDHAGLWLELNQLLGCRVDVVTERGLRAQIKERVLKQAIPI